MVQNWPSIKAKFLAGGLLAYPTEAVWGLGCDPWNAAAVRRLQAYKRRSPHKGLILVAGSLAQVMPLLAHLSEAQRQTMLARWPGPVTYLIPRPPRIPQWVCGSHDTLAIRYSAHPGVQALTQHLGSVLISTSANRAGKPPAKSAVQVLRWFGRDAFTVIPGPLGKEKAPSQIYDLGTGQRLR